MFELLNTIDAFVWGPAMIALLLGSHLFFTFKTGFIQRKLPQAIKLSLSSDPEGKGDISHFGALATALAATIGTGSIVGVATAILAGGPGAVFWMWITGVFGIATKYAEVYAAVKYRVRDPILEVLFALSTLWSTSIPKYAGRISSVHDSSVNVPALVTKPLNGTVNVRARGYQATLSLGMKYVSPDPSTKVVTTVL